MMQYAKPRFRPVKAHGSIGDKKNDGYDSKTGTYYQVYAPDDVRKTQGEALSKLRRDFKLVFDSSSSEFDVSPFAMGRDSSSDVKSWCHADPEISP